MNAVIQPGHNLDQIAQFFAALPETDSNASLKRFSYVAVKKGDNWNLLRGRLDFNPAPRSAEPPFIYSDLVRAETIDLSAAGLTPKTLLEQLLNGSVTLPAGVFGFAKADGSHHTLFYMPNINSNGQPVESRLQVSGRQNLDLFDFSAVNLDLEGVKGFHSSLDRLLELYELRPDFSGAGVWFVNLPIAELIRYQEQQAGADIELRLRKGFAAEQISVGIRYSTANGEAPALTLTSNSLRWSEQTSESRGVMRLVLPRPTQIKLTVIHNGKPQHVAYPKT